MALSACASAPEPFDYQSENELKPGPGVLTGEEGMWTITGSPPPAKTETPAAQKDQATPGANPDGEDDTAPSKADPE